MQIFGIHLNIIAGRAHHLDNVTSDQTLFLHGLVAAHV